MYTMYYKQLKKAFTAGSHFKEKYYKEVHLLNSDIVLREPDFEKYLKSKKIPFFVCDGCKEKAIGKGNKAYDENYNIRKGLKYCDECAFK